MTLFQSRTPSPSSSPSLAPIDSSPPSSPSPIDICTPPGSPGAQDPFAGSTKSNKRPRIYERDGSKRLSAKFAAYTPRQPHFGEVDDALTRTPQPDDATPTRVVDPFSASAKRTWRPPTYEKKHGRVLSNESATSASSSASYAYGTKAGASPTPASRGITMTLDDPDDDFTLTDDEHEKPRVRRESREEIEHRLWDEAITAAIDNLNGVIDLSVAGLSKGTISHIPPTITDLENFIVLPPTQATSSAPSSPKQSPKQLPSQSPPAEPAFSSSRPFTRATTLPAAAFNEPFFLKSKDGERLRGTPAARAASLHSVAQPTTQLRRRELQMFLANNVITRLPPELFRVSSLTVLSLRANALTTVPPQIAQLTSLQELNLAQNQLRWLPAEMLNMRLTKLSVAGNPWIPPPSDTESAHASSLDQGVDSARRRRRPVSPTIVYFTVPPLTEICFRVLLAPYPSHTHHPPPHPSPASQSPSEPSASTSKTDPSPAPHPTPPPPRPLTVLEAAYALPLTEEHGLGPSVLATFRACVPAAVAKPPTAEQLAGPTKVRRDEGQRDVHSALREDVFGGPGTRAVRAGSLANTGRTGGPSKASALASEDEDEADPPALSVCPSPAHQGQARVPVFVQPAEERWTWEEVVAGVRVGAEGVGGVGVPVRWRGCGRGCLDFLDPQPEEPTSAVREGEAGAGDGGEAVRVDLHGDGDVEMEAAMGDLELEGGEEADMQEVRFEGGLADPEDFEEGF
ncbi:hypothetical protein OH77DRAFT_1429165 [Trametes cingulata]|nr:hypothetical protein OH77DRAFT_1429165 [Trametes cingulata]